MGASSMSSTRSSRPMRAPTKYSAGSGRIRWMGIRRSDLAFNIVAPTRQAPDNRGEHHPAADQCGAARLLANHDPYPKRRQGHIDKPDKAGLARGNETPAVEEEQISKAGGHRPEHRKHQHFEQ